MNALGKHSGFSLEARTIFAALLFASAFLLATRYVYLFGAVDLGLDFRVFQRAGNLPIDQLYGDRGTTPFVYPPPAILLFKPFASLPGAFWLWSGLSILAFAIAAIAVWGWRITTLSLCSPAAVFGLVLGQVPMLLAGMMLAGIKLSSYLGGALWGVAATIKPQLFLLAPVALLVRKDWRMLGGMAMGVATAVLASLAAYGPAAWAEWYAAMDDFSQAVIQSGTHIRTITPAGRAAVIGLPILPIYLTSAFLGLAAVIAVSRKVGGGTLVALIIAASLVSSPYAFRHDTIALIPACVALVLGGPWWAAIPAALVIIGTPGLTMLGMMIGLAAVSVWALRADRMTTTASREQSTAVTKCNLAGAPTQN